MKTTGSIVIVAFLASISSASPFSPRALVCNQAPPATGGTPKALASPAAANAAACMQQCSANTGCQSFVFGLPPSESAPKCMLFGVPGAQIPSQGTDLHVFDKACAANTVPKQAPTHANPIGPAVGKGQGQGQGQNQGGAGGQAQPKGGAVGQTQRKGVVASQSQGRGPAGQGKDRRANVCGASPAGHATSAAKPFQTQPNIATQQACLDLCKRTDKCQSIEFGRTAASDPDQCMLFNVPAANLPRPGNGQSLKASDIGC